MLIVFLAEVAGAIVLFVFTGVVSAKTSAYKRLPPEGSTVDRILSLLPPQAGELFAQVEEAIRKDIKANYGENPTVTGLWNTTMEQVMHPPRPRKRWERKSLLVCLFVCLFLR